MRLLKVCAFLRKVSRRPKGKPKSSRASAEDIVVVETARDDDDDDPLLEGRPKLLFLRFVTPSFLVVPREEVKDKTETDKEQRTIPANK